MSARVFSVGIEIPGNVAEHVPIRDDKSLFDGDVILFRPPSFYEYTSHETYAGHRLIDEDDSPDALRDCRHWKGELKAAIESGKVVFVFLIKPADVYYDTGTRTHSGTGRSRVTTRQVAPLSSYECLPVRLEGLVPRGGTEISVMAELGPLSLYWSQFGVSSAYEIYFESAGLQPLLGTKNREKAVGAMVRTKGGGALVLLPPVQWEEEDLTYTRGKSTFWRKEAAVLGKRLVTALVATSDALRRAGKRSPVPEWAAQPEYALLPETQLRAEISRLDEALRQTAEKRKALEVQLEEAGALHGLVYESGKPLEGAILKALSLLGFSAEPYRDAQSEFDAVFTSAEGRFLGEAEGKDNKAVNIDKMSQLERNLQEDFAREEVTAFAKGVLFGNAYRLELPDVRGDFFTPKCVSAAKRLGVALVRTPDLFLAARYLSEHDNPDYAKACRESLLNAAGEIVVFPPVAEIDEGGA